LEIPISLVQGGYCDRSHQIGDSLGECKWAAWYQNMFVPKSWWDKAPKIVWFSQYCKDCN